MEVSPASAYELLVESFIKHGSLKQKTISSNFVTFLFFLDFFKAKQVTLSKKLYPRLPLSLENLSNFGIYFNERGGW